MSSMCCHAGVDNHLYPRTMIGFLEPASQPNRRQSLRRSAILVPLEMHSSGSQCHKTSVGGCVGLCVGVGVGVVVWLLDNLNYLVLGLRCCASWLLVEKARRVPATTKDRQLYGGMNLTEKMCRQSHEGDQCLGHYPIAS